MRGYGLGPVGLLGWIEDSLAGRWEGWAVVGWRLCCFALEAAGAGADYVEGLGYSG